MSPFVLEELLVSQVLQTKIDLTTPDIAAIMFLQKTIEQCNLHNCIITKTIKHYNLHNCVITLYACSPYNYVSYMLLLFPFN